MLTNPYCCTVPRPDGDHIVLDFATSAIAIGKLRVAHMKSEPAPHGVLIDGAGFPTTDTNAFFTPGARAYLLPFGQHKGGGMQVLCELLGGALAGQWTMQPGSDREYGAAVNNKSKLAYNAVGAWLAGSSPLPPAAAAVPGMDEQLRLQDRVAQALDALRAQHGALGFETIEVETVFDGDIPHEVRPQAPNRAKSLIANLMIAANGVTARFLDARGFPSLRRVVKSPERWDRIRALAEQLGDSLPDAADSIALAAFLDRRKKADPQAFPDLSMSIIRLLGRGEYVVDPPGEEPPGHFGLAVRDYSHSTAPNRRFPDLVTQRLVKAALAGHQAPYSIGELGSIATRCTAQEDAANKVERQVRKSAAAMIVQSRIGETFDAMVTGASSKGTFVRVWAPPIEGKLLGSHAGLDVGDRLRVRLSGVNIDRGFIDFERA